VSAKGLHPVEPESTPTASPTGAGAALPYEPFKARHLESTLEMIGGRLADEIRRLSGDEAELVSRLIYFIVVARSKNPGVGPREMVHAVHRLLAGRVVSLAESAEAARAAYSRVPWDTLPGLDVYGREGVNAVASRALADAAKDAAAGGP
jgi:hypothetical protein